MIPVVRINGIGLFFELGHQDYLCGSPIEGTRVIEVRQTVLGDIEIEEYKRLGFDTYYKLVAYLEANGHPGVHTAFPITIVYHTTEGESKS